MTNLEHQRSMQAGQRLMMASSEDAIESYLQRMEGNGELIAGAAAKLAPVILGRNKASFATNALADCRRYLDSPLGQLYVIAERVADGGSPMHPVRAELGRHGLDDATQSRLFAEHAANLVSADAGSMAAAVFACVHRHMNGTASPRERMVDTPAPAPSPPAERAGTSALARSLATARGML